MAGLTACSGTGGTYVVHDMGERSVRKETSATPLKEQWGFPSDEYNVQDPELAPGFLIEVSYLEDSKLNGDFRIDFDGALALPYDVRIDADGITLSELKEKLVEAYSRYFKNASGIRLRVKERRYWVDVRGLVQKPGRYLVDGNTSLDQLIVMAGGLSKDTPPHYARIQKNRKIFVLDLNQYYSKGEEHPQIQGWIGGEVVFFGKDIADSLKDRLPPSPYRLPVTMLGEVRKPGEYPLKAGTGFVDLLAQADGFTEAADLDHLELLRKTQGKRYAYAFSWDHLEQAPAPGEGDVIIVHADKQTKFERKVTLGSIVASVLTSIAILVIEARK